MVCGTSLGWVLSGKVPIENEKDADQFCFETHVMRCDVENSFEAVRKDLKRF